MGIPNDRAMAMERRRVGPDQLILWNRTQRFNEIQPEG